MSEIDKLKAVEEFIRARNELEALVIQKEVHWGEFNHIKQRVDRLVKDKLRERET